MVTKTVVEQMKDVIFKKLTLKSDSKDLLIDFVDVKGFLRSNGCRKKIFK